MRRNPATTTDLVSGAYVLTTEIMTTFEKSSGNFYTYDETGLGTSTIYSGMAPCVECTEPAFIISYSVSGTTKYYVVGYKNGKVFTGSIIGLTGTWTLI